MIPRAEGAASRLREEAEGYKQRIVAQAKGDAERFKSVLAEYQKAPQVTRERMYVDTMQQIYGNVTKIMVDSRQGNNLLYLPLDKIMQQVTAPAVAPASSPMSSSSIPSSPPASLAGSRTRDAERSRDRDVR